MQQKVYDAIYGATMRLAATFLAPMIDALIDFSIQRSAERLSLVDFTNTAAKSQAMRWVDVLDRFLR
jgi:hypothetical protein